MKSLWFGPLLLLCPPLSGFNLLSDTAQVICTEAAVNGPHPRTWLHPLVHQSLWLVPTHCLAFAKLSRLCLKG